MISRNTTIVAGALVLAGLLGFILSRVSFETDDTILPGLAFALSDVDYHVQAYILILLLATALFVFFVIPRVAAGEGLWLKRLLVTAFFFKVAVGLFRVYWMWVEKGGADSRLYFGTGSRFAENVWKLDFRFLETFANPGTDFTELYAIFVMAFTGPSLPGVFLVFGLFSFVAAILYYKAFCMVFPDGNRKLFAALIFFFPSWTYWPSSIGKDSLMALFIAIAAYGLAMVVARRNFSGLLVIGIGVLAAYTIRPHIAALLGLGMALPLIFRLPVGSHVFSPLLRAVCVVAVVASAWMLLNSGAASAKIKEASVEGVLDRYDALSSRAERGGSSFAPTPLTEPLGVPTALVTVLFRPFVWEAPNAAARVLAFEGAIFALVVLWRLKALGRAVVSSLSNPYVIFLLIYFISWALALTVIGNFSLLGRQRLMVLPAFFMLLSFPTLAEAKRNANLLKKRAPEVSRAGHLAPDLLRGQAG